MDDLGGAYGLGIDALRAVVQATDGRGPATVLCGAVCQALDIGHTDDLMHRLYTGRFGKEGVARLARLVTAAADAGDEVAGRILSRGAAELGAMAAAVQERLGFSQPEVALTGGTGRHSALYREKIYTALQEAVPGCRITEPELEPVLGAVLLALEGRSRLPDGELIHNLNQAPITTGEKPC